MFGACVSTRAMCNALTCYVLSSGSSGFEGVINWGSLLHHLAKNKLYYAMLYFEQTNFSVLYYWILHYPILYSEL